MDQVGLLLGMVVLRVCIQEGIGEDYRTPEKMEPEEPQEHSGYSLYADI